MARVKDLMDSADSLRKLGKTAEAAAKSREADRLMDEIEVGKNHDRYETWSRELDSTQRVPGSSYGLKVERSTAVPTNAERFAAISRSSLSLSERYSDPTLDKDYANEFLEYIHSRGRHVGSRLHSVNAELSALNLNSDSAGVGYLAPGDIRTQILSRLPAVSEFLDNVTVVQARGDMVKWPRMKGNTTSSVSSIYTSAGVGVMVDETPASATLTEQQFGLFEIPIKRGRYIAKPSMDAIEDIPNLMQFLGSDAAVNLGLLMEAQSLNGDGIGPNVLGVLNNGVATNGSQTEAQFGTVDVSGTTADQVSNTIADTGSAPKLLSLFYAVPQQYRRQSGFRMVFASDTERRIRSLTDAMGRFYWAADGGFGSPTDGFLNKPIAVSEFTPVGGTDGNRIIYAGDLSSLILAVNGGIRIQVADQLYAESDRIGLFVRVRFGIGVANFDSARLGIV